MSAPDQALCEMSEDQARPAASHSERENKLNSTNSLTE
jgi:hypothetical protein